jgi:putative nucleotidyltransferase with HDIG domain
MASLAKAGKEGNRKANRFLLKRLQKMRSQLTWREVLVGLATSILLAAILAGFRQQVIPEFEVDQVANQDIRASKDVQYVDQDATALKRSEAMDSVPSVYELDQNRISEIKNSIRTAFQNARSFLEDKAVAARGSLSQQQQKALLPELKTVVGGILSEEILPPLLRDRFDPVTENQILKVLDAVLREGIIEDPDRFAKEQRMGIVIRDSSFPFEHLLTDADLVRDLPEAREYLRQFDLELPKWSEKEKKALTRYLEAMLVPTLVYNKKETEARRELAASQVQVVEVQIKRGQTVVRYGERITPSLLRQLHALRNLWKPSSLILSGLGFFIFIVVFLYALWRYLLFLRSRLAVIRKHAALILVIVTSELLIVRLASTLADILNERFNWFQDPSSLYYAIPFALGPLLAALLVDVNLGVTACMILATLVGLFYGDIAIAVYTIMGGLAGIYSIRQYKDRAGILQAGFAIGILNCICLAGLHILRRDPVNLPTALHLLALALISGLLASTVASIMLPALEYFFKIVTDIRLLELSNLNHPILRRLSVEAPGTYHHSLMVATLAEDAAEAIGANPLLARVSAYYHDIGKILKPEYFVENQSLEYNKHEQLSPRMSSLVLASHVKDGLQLAKEIGLPQRIREMIPQHHGTRMMSYFFQKAKDSFGDKNGQVSDADFRYSGPKPQSREAAIMMMADSVEAASRTLTDPNPSQIKGMIDRLVDGIMKDEQFDECDITFKDVRLVEESFFKILTGIFHRRIDYPTYDFKQNGAKAGNTAFPNSDTQQAKTL